jgi:hypothetical protein
VSELPRKDPTGTPLECILSHADGVFSAAGAGMKSNLCSSEGNPTRLRFDNWASAAASESLLK